MVTDDPETAVPETKCYLPAAPSSCRRVAGRSLPVRSAAGPRFFHLHYFVINEFLEFSGLECIV
jgi:hypothetical protein